MLSVALNSRADASAWPPGLTFLALRILHPDSSPLLLPQCCCCASSATGIGSGTNLLRRTTAAASGLLGVAPLDLRISTVTSTSVGARARVHAADQGHIVAVAVVADL